MDYPAQPSLPEANIIGKSPSSSGSSKKFFFLGLLIVVIFCLGGFIAYQIYLNYKLDAKLKQSLKQSSPIPTLGIPLP